MKSKSSSSPSRAFTFANLLEAVSDDQEWLDYLPRFFRENGKGLHLAIMVEPYLTYILKGKKTIESRFSVNKCAPYGKIRGGDVIMLKRPGGLIVGVCQVSDAWFYRLDRKSWYEIKNNFFDEIYVSDNNFWDKRQNAIYATLIRVKNARDITPFEFPKKDRRGWVVIKPANNQLTLDPKAS